MVPEKSEEFLSAGARRELLSLVRTQIAAALRSGAVSQSDPPLNAELHELRGAFVTLRRADQLRGCIGTFFANRPLYLIAVDMGHKAATQDPRFPPVTAEEFELCTIEISVLTPLRQIDDPSIIEIGRHGIFIRRGFASGVLLPQVAVEHRWDRETFLRQTCRKAGLPDDAWRSGATIEVFEAEILEEDELAG